MIKKIINFKKAIKHLKKPNEAKHDLHWISCGSHIKITEKGRNTVFLIAEVVGIEEQKTSSIPKKLEIKVMQCNDDIDLVNTIIELCFVKAKQGKKPIFKINKNTKKIYNNNYVIEDEAA